jgi:hypothetical protein
MLEALILAMAFDPGASSFAEAAAPRPSLDLLEFLGEFGDDEEDLFDAEASASGSTRSPARSRDVAPAAPVPPKLPAPPRTTPKETA